MVVHLRDQLRADEQFLAEFMGEESDFVRFNHGRYRQPGSVLQSTLSLRWLQGGRQAQAEVSLSGDPSVDRARLSALVEEFRELLPLLPVDPLLSVNQASDTLEDVEESALPPTGEIAAQFLDAAGVDVDLVGMLASGRLWRGFASSWGQRDWFERGSFSLDWCLVADSDKAVKGAYAGPSFDPATLRARLEEGRKGLEILRRPSRKVDPGEYRAWMSPAAMEEILGLLSWNAFSARNLAARTSPLFRLDAGEVALDPRVQLAEDLAGGVAPRFQSDGFRKPARIPLIAEGRLVGRLTSPRTGEELHIPHTGASTGETPVALAMAGGDIPSNQVLSRLGEGVYIGNLWYLNWSDRASCRFTGMTRFATFWVEGGEIVAPLSVMRFDDSLYRMWGPDNLIGLGEEPAFLQSTDTYFRRSTQSVRVPGALVSGFRLTL